MQQCANWSIRLPHAIEVGPGRLLETLGAARAFVERSRRIRHAFTLDFVTRALDRAACSGRHEDVEAASRHLVGALFFEARRPMARDITILSARSQELRVVVSPALGGAERVEDR